MGIKETLRSICSKTYLRMAPPPLLLSRTRYFHMEVAKDCTTRASRQPVHRMALRLHLRPNHMARQARRSNKHSQHKNMSQNQRLRTRGRRRMHLSYILLFDRSTIQCSTTNISHHAVNTNLLLLHILHRLIKWNDRKLSKAL